MSSGADLSVQPKFPWLSGRLPRKPYWIAISFFVGAQLLATKAAPEDSGLAFLSDFGDILVAALIGRRMRDFGWSPFWAWLGIAVIPPSLVPPGDTGLVQRSVSPPITWHVVMATPSSGTNAAADALAELVTSVA